MPHTKFIIILSLVAIVVLSIAVRQWWTNRSLIRKVTNRRRGTPSERSLILTLLKMGVLPETLFHDLYIHRGNGKYAQIDAVMVSTVGIIVFEVKDYTGSIYGKGYYQNWLKVVGGGKEKFEFYNPVLQNEGHIDALRRKLRAAADVPFYSVIVFYGNCKLKKISDLPYKTYVCYASEVRKTVAKIKKDHYKVRYNDRPAVLAAMREAVANGAHRQVVKQHIRNVNDSHPK